MGRLVLAGNPLIEIALRRSARARRLSLRISQLDGRVTLTLPTHVSEAEGRAFATEKRAWIAQHLDARPDVCAVQVGVEIPVLGVPRRVISGQGRTVRLSGAELHVPGARQSVPRRLQAFLKQLARGQLAAASDEYAALLGKPYTKLSLRDTRSRWGSCSSAGALMYSWRLIMAPPDVLRYVAAHEVAHLAHMDHSPAFWSVVHDLYGDHATQRAWLRTEGTRLHAFRFES